MVLDKSAKKRDLISLVLTGIIIFGIIVAGPVEAVIVKIDTNKQVYKDDDTDVQFVVSVDIQKNEIVPLKYLTLYIEDDFNKSNAPVKVCKFYPDGSIIYQYDLHHNIINNTCENIVIVPVNEGNRVESDNLSASGYGYGDQDKPKSDKISFGYGYGYEEEIRKAGTFAELTYGVQWDISNEPAANGKYSTRVEALAVGSSRQYTYTSKGTNSFHLQRSDIARALVQEEFTITGSEVDITEIGTADPEFTKQDVLFEGTVRKATLEGVDYVDGKISITAYAEKNDTTKVWLNMVMRDTDLVEYGEQSIEIVGPAEVDYKKTKQGSWINANRQGREKTEQLSATLKYVYVTINREDNTVSIMSTDKRLPIDIDLEDVQIEQNS